MITDSRVGRQPTGERLLDVGLRLFATQGFRETTVGEIEAGAGLQPRRGALYRHFASKEALLLAALQRHLDAIGEASASLDEPPTGDVRAGAMAMGRWLLAELDRERVIVQILEQDGDRLPELRDAFRHQLVDVGYVLVAGLAQQWLGAAAEGLDLEAVSVVLLGSLVNYRRSTWTFAAPPFELDDERFLSCWADLCATTTAALRSRDR
jgi:AcrR family transcriptional regulator